LRVDDAPLRLLVTGGCGFIGSNFCRYVLETRRDWSVCNLDALTYAGNLENLRDVENDPRYRFVRADAADRAAVDRVVSQGVDVVVNFAAETHVDRSIADPSAVVRNNVLSVETLLATAQAHGVRRFVQISTDEVYGSLGPTGRFTEESPLRPNNPYSASKAAADLLCRAYRQTFGLPVVILRCSNNYGPYQFPEKVIPLFITNALAGRPLPLYGDGRHVRDWIYVRDFCRAIALAVERGEPGEIYNVGGGGETPNIEIAKMILDAVGRPHALIHRVKDRPGHDRRYAMDATKIQRELGWRAEVSLPEGLAATVAWYREHADWWQRVKDGAYREYYREHYVLRHGLDAADA